EDRVARPWRERTSYTARAEHDLGVIVPRAAFGGDEIVLAIALQQMRPFDPARLRGDIDAAVHDQRPLAHELLRLEIQLLNPDRAMAAVERRPNRRTVVDDVSLPVVVEEDRRIDPVEAEPHGIRPRPGGIRRRHQKVAAAIDARVDEIERALVIS